MSVWHVDTMRKVVRCIYPKRVKNIGADIDLFGIGHKRQRNVVLRSRTQHGVNKRLRSVFHVGQFEIVLHRTRYVENQGDLNFWEAFFGGAMCGDGHRINAELAQIGCIKLF